MLNKGRPERFHIFIIILLSVISRLPQLLSPYLFLDGDECIVGLMARHLLEGREFPVYFYGQGYAFCLPETALISFFYLFTGVSDWAMKLAMLCIWIGGVTLFYLTVKQLNEKSDSKAAFVLTLIFILSPAWALWSMKGGGYLSAFFLFNLIVYLTLNRKWQRRTFIWFISGFLLVIIYESQGLWLSGLIPILAFTLFKLGGWKRTMAAALGATGGILAFLLMNSLLEPAYSPSFLSMPDWERLARIPGLLWLNLTGSYAYGGIISMSIATRVMATLALVLLVAGLVWSVVRVIKDRLKGDLLPALALALPATILTGALTQNMVARYFLPVWGIVMLIMAVFVIAIGYGKVIRVAAFVLMLIGSLSLYSFRDYRYESRQELMGCINYLDSNQIGYVFAEGGLLQWQLIFYSDERIKARYLYRIDRYPPYVQAVNDALVSGNKGIGLLGYNNQGDTAVAKDFVSPGGTFFVLKEPDSLLLKKRGFEFN